VRTPCNFCTSASVVAFLELLGGLRDLVLDGRAPLRRVVGYRDIVVRRAIDCRKRFVLVGGPLDGWPPGVWKLTPTVA